VLKFKVTKNSKIKIKNKNKNIKSYHLLLTSSYDYIMRPSYYGHTYSQTRFAIKPKVNYIYGNRGDNGIDYEVLIMFWLDYVVWLV